MPQNIEYEMYSNVGSPKIAVKLLLKSKSMKEKKQ